MQNEILALGVITLVLTALSSELQKICISGQNLEPSNPCPPGMTQMFTAELIDATHLLLFEAAVLHIIITAGSFYLCLLRLRLWRNWEARARAGHELRIDHTFVRQRLGR